MKIFSFILLAIIAIPLYAQNYDQYFTSETMRLDTHHYGVMGFESFSYDKTYKEGSWPGSKVNLIDVINYGEYEFKVFDVATSALIYSRGYSSMFGEWITTDEAGRGIYRTFHESLRFPFPKNPVRVVISRRDKQMKFKEVFSTTIDPNSPAQVNTEKRYGNFKVTQVFNSGPSEKKVDLLILGDGYTKSEIEKFQNDVKYLVDVMFSTSPFKERKNDFNVWAIEVESPESGIDKPDKNIWKSSALGTMYNTFGSARYILTEDNQKLRDISSAAPYDFIYILINDNRYGGGGIYNFYATCYTISDIAGQEWQREYVFVHEFGHSFGGLGDEYYSSDAPMAGLYNKYVDPWEPNITSNIDREKIKWSSFIDPQTPLPTPWDKTTFDSIETLKGKLDRLAPNYYEKREPLYQASQKILKESLYHDKVGAFEGAGYASNGLYRPAIDCRMFTLSLVDFCPVCRAAIERMIDFYTK